jgi:hypothetical protein
VPDEGHPPGRRGAGRQCYQPDTAVLTTDLVGATGRVRIADAVALRSGADLTEDTSPARAELVRSAVALAVFAMRRIGFASGAAGQRQHDVDGEVLGCAHRWLRSGGEMAPWLWSGLTGPAGAWQRPDQGIWEVRSEGRMFPYSAGMSQVALDRAAGIGERLGLPGPIADRRAAAEHVPQAFSHIGVMSSGVTLARATAGDSHDRPARDLRRDG